jgi:RNA-binding protein of telomerase ribonucleoprotein complex
MDLEPDNIHPFTRVTSLKEQLEPPQNHVVVGLVGEGQFNDAAKEQHPPLQDPDATYVTSSAHVAAFTKAAIKKAVPKVCWGDEEEGSYNQSIILDAAVEFIVRRKFESLTLHDVLQKLKVSGFL